jgi:hypothetical protein
MAYMSQEMKKQLAPGIRAVLKKYGVKGTISVRNHSSLAVTLREGPFDFIKEANRYNQERAARTGERAYTVEGNFDVNVYHIDSRYTGKMKQFLTELYREMMKGNHNNSDIMTDYFDVGWYTDISVGRWDKPYVCTGEKILQAV